MFCIDLLSWIHYSTTFHFPFSINNTGTSLYFSIIAGYHNVSLIPAGATNIDIQQHGYQHLKDDENYLGKETDITT